MVSKIIIKFFIVLLLCFVTLQKGWAFAKNPNEKVTKIVIVPEKNILNFENVVNFEIQGLINLDQFVIKPRVNNGTAQIEGEDGLWVSQETTWSKMPKVKNSIRIKILGTQENIYEVGFELQNILTGKVYKTNEVRIWSNSYIKRQIGLVNNSLMANASKGEDVDYKSEDVSNAQYATNPASNEEGEGTRQKSIKSYFALYGLLFFLSVAIGFKMVKFNNASNSS